MDDGEAGACAICYALHLPDPARPDELGKGAQLLVLTACVVLTGVLVLEQVHCIGQCAITRWSLTWLLFYNHVPIQQANACVPALPVAVRKGVLCLPAAPACTRQ
jgi:hypothetical protein